MIRDCDSFGAGDAALYPGAAPETGAQATAFYPDAPRANTVIKRCDMRGSALGYSGSMGNGVRITNNHIYGNGAGIASDTLSAAGHPGFPADSSEIDHNFIYSNNLNLYQDNAPVKPLVGTPVGTGVIYAGMNDAKVHDNWIFDNWRDGVMLFAVPDALVNGGGAEGDIFPGVSCPGAPANTLSTSCNNRFYNNKMGQKPPGFRFPAEVDQFDRFAVRSRQSQAVDAQRQRLLVGRVLRQHQELLVREHGIGRHSGERDRARRRRTRRWLAARPAAWVCERNESRPERGRGRCGQDPVSGRLLQRPGQGHVAAGLRLVVHTAQARQPGGCAAPRRIRQGRGAVCPLLRRASAATAHVRAVPGWIGDAGRPGHAAGRGLPVRRV